MKLFNFLMGKKIGDDSESLGAGQAGGDPAAGTPIPDECENKHRPEHFDRIVSLLLDSDPEVRLDAIAALEELGDPRAVEPLCSLVRDSDPSIRARAVFAVGSFDDRRSVAVIKQASRDADLWVCHQAANAGERLKLTRKIRRLAEDLHSPDSEVVEKTLKALAELREPRVHDLLARTLREGYPGARAGAAKALGEVQSENAVECLAVALKDRDAVVRLAAVVSLERQRFPEVLPPLIRALADPAPQVSEKALLSITRRMTTPYRLPLNRDNKPAALFEKLLASKNFDVRRNAAELLKYWGDERDGPALVKTLNVRDKFTWIAVIQALGAIRYNGAVPVLADLLRDPDGAVKVEAIRALGRISTRESNEALLPVLFDNDQTPISNDKNFRFKHFAAIYIGRYGDPLALPILKEALDDPVLKYHHLRRELEEAYAKVKNTEHQP